MIVTEARTTDMITFLEHYSNFTFIQKGNTYRCREHQSLAINADRLSWYWHSKGVGGYGVLDFLMKIEGYGFRQAMEQLNSIPLKQPVQMNDTEQAPKALILPEKAFLYNRLYAYLGKTRGIDNNIITTLIQEKKLYEDAKSNVVFVGYDERNKPKYASLRGTYTDKPFRMECAGSDKRYGFNMTYKETEKLYIFEAPIDALSHATLENLTTGNKNAWKNDSRLSLGGISSIALDKYIELHPLTNEFVFCLDNDKAGHEAAVKMVRRYTDMGYYARLELPQNKDFNEDLLTYRKQHVTKVNERTIDYGR